MDEKLFPEVFDMELLSKNSILVDERGCFPCDFLLFELAKHLRLAIFQFNEDGVRLRQAFAKLNGNFTVNSIYSAEYNAEDIVDDVTAQKIIQVAIKPRIGVFRSGTATTVDYYDYDLVMIVDRLESGCSTKMDGILKLIRRDQCIVECKYKVLSDKIIYYV